MEVVRFEFYLDLDLFLVVNLDCCDLLLFLLKLLRKLPIASQAAVLCP